MAKRERPHDRDGHEPERSDARGRDYPVFSALRGARWQGSAPRTAQAFARALSQWRRMPGAVGVAASDLGNIPPAPGQTGEDRRP